MKKIIKFNLIALLALVFFVSSCDDEDNTGYTDLIKTNPTITVSGIQGGGYSFIETDSVFRYNVTLSEAQIVDIAIYVTQIDGNATAGEDYVIVNTNSRVYIPANSTTGVLEIKVLTDEIKEGEETFTLQIGDERTTNAAITPVTAEFTIQNYTEGDLAIDMSWDTEVYDEFGALIDPIDVADMIVYIYDDAGNNLGAIDGSGFESFVFNQTAPDGTYHLQAGFYSVMDLENDFDVNITLDFFQLGVLDVTFNNYVGLVQTSMAELCDLDIRIATIVKVGTDWTLTETGEVEFSFDNADFVGNYGGDDGNDVFYAANVDIAEVGADLTIDGLCSEWMVDYWGEAITEQVPVVIIINTDGTIEIEEQYLMTTSWGGDPYVYNIFGEGTYNLCNYSLHIVYELHNVTDDYNVAETYMGAYFTADIELGAKSSIEVGKSYRVNVDIPVRVR